MNGLPLTVSDANGTVTTLTYDARQRLTSSTIAGETTSIDYWPTGLVQQVTQPDGSFVAYDYDDAHRLVEVSDIAGNRIAYTLTTRPAIRSRTAPGRTRTTTRGAWRRRPIRG